MVTIVEMFLAFFVLLPLLLVSSAIHQFNELRPHHYSYYDGSLNLRSQMDTTMLVKVEFSRNKKFNENDCILFDYRVKNSIGIYYIPPDTLYVEGPCEIVSRVRV